MTYKQPEKPSQSLLQTFDIPLHPFNGDIWLVHAVILCGGALALSLTRILLKSNTKCMAAREFGLACGSTLKPFWDKDVFLNA